jgi:protein-arginine kinase activator protein McsA
MTVKALREMAKEIPEITGVHGMKKEELLVAINKVRGVEEKTVKADKTIKGKPVKKAGASTGEIKKQIKALKAQRQAALGAKDKKMATVYRRRISRLKKKSKKAAALSAG